MLAVRRFATKPRSDDTGARVYRAPDGAVNVVRPYGRGHLEARMLYRDLDKPDRRRTCIYLSSHSGCRMGCRFCFLTQQGQTSMKHADVHQFVAQAVEMLRAYEKNDVRTEDLHFNYMARGDPGANSAVLNEWSQLSGRLHAIGESYRFKTVRSNLSTIMPTVIDPYNLYNVFAHRPPMIYYSLYSLDQGFREKWMPNAMPVRRALDKLAALQRQNGLPLTFHWAVIRGANDSLDDARAIAELIKKYEFDARFSLVRYNAFPGSGTAEASEERLAEIRHILDDAVKSSKVITRIHPQQYMACGMFPADD